MESPSERMMEGNMEQKTMTKKEVLNITVNILGKINVPVALMDDIGIPIRNAISNILMVVDALEKEEVKEYGQEADAE